MTNEESARLNFGKYKVPETLSNLIQIQEELISKGYLKTSGLFQLYYNEYGVGFRFENTPVDVIIFADPAQSHGDEYYGFLTDFGSVTDLEDAYIVRLVPYKEENSIQIVSRNLRDFLRLCMYHPIEASFLNMHSTKEECEESAEGSRKYNASKLDEERYTDEVLKKTLHLEPIEDVYQYFNHVLQTRNNRLITSTSDDLGVVLHSNQSNVIIEAYFENENCDSIQTSNVIIFFENTNFESKLLFFREMIYLSINQELKDYLISQLYHIGLNDEAIRLEHTPNE
jgi:hypothetical protein